MSKIIIMDVDGTLVDYLGQVPESATQAIKAARANGHRVYICTGRAKAQTYPYIWDIGLDGMIGGNGSFVEDDGQMIMEETLSKEDCTQIVNWLDSNQIPFYLESNNGLFGSATLKKFEPMLVKRYLQSIGKDENLPFTLENVFPGMVLDGNMYRDDVNKVSYFLVSEHTYQAAKDAFPHLKSRTWGPNHNEPIAGELALPGITKGKAVDKLLEHLGAKIEDTIAIGDANVDIPLLEHCAIKVAMGNGSDEIKEIADLVTDPVDQDGLYNAFVKLGLIEG